MHLQGTTTAWGPASASCSTWFDPSSPRTGPSRAIASSIGARRLNARKLAVQPITTTFGWRDHLRTTSRATLWMPVAKRLSAVWCRSTTTAPETTSTSDQTLWSRAPVSNRILGSSRRASPSLAARTSLTTSPGSGISAPTTERASHAVLGDPSASRSPNAWTSERAPVPDASVPTAAKKVEIRRASASRRSARTELEQPLQPVAFLRHARVLGGIRPPETPDAVHVYPSPASASSSGVTSTSQRRDA